MPEHYDHLETRNPTLRESEEFAVLHGIVAHAMKAPGWAKHLAGIDPKSITSRAALAKLPVHAQIRHRGAAKRKSAVRRAQRHAARQGQAPVDVARADLRAGRPRRRLVGRGARLFCRRLPLGRYRAQQFRLSSDARRFHSRVGRACAWLRRHSRRRRQYRAATRRDRALQAVGLYRHAGLSENPARYRAKDRQGRLLVQARSGIGRGLAGLAAR